MTCRSFFFWSHKFFSGVEHSGVENKPVVSRLGEYIKHATCFTRARLLHCQLLFLKRVKEDEEIKPFFCRSSLLRPLRKALCCCARQRQSQEVSNLSILFLPGGIVPIIPLPPTRKTQQTIPKNKISKLHRNSLNKTPSNNPTQTTTYPTLPQPTQHLQNPPTPTKPPQPPHNPHPADSRTRLFFIATLRDKCFIFLTN